MATLSNEELIQELQTTAVRIGMGGYVQEFINKADELAIEILARFARYEQTLQEIAALADRMLEGK